VLVTILSATLCIYTASKGSRDARDSRESNVAEASVNKDLIEYFDKPEILSVIFHPRPDYSPPDAARDVTIPLSDGVTLGGRVYVARLDSPLILFFHGNGEIASDYDDIAPHFTREGISILVVDFRGYGRSGGMPTVSNLLSDARATYEALPALLAGRGLSPSRIFVMGRSLGSASAIEIAAHARNGIAGLIIESGYAYGLRLIARLGGPTIDTSNDGKVGTAALAKMPGIEVPTLIIHGEEDFMIPVEDAHALHEHSGAADKRLVTIPHAGHNDLFWTGRDRYIAAVKKLILGSDDR